MLAIINQWFLLNVHVFVPQPSVRKVSQGETSTGGLNLNIASYKL